MSVRASAAGCVLGRLVSLFTAASVVSTCCVSEIAETDCAGKKVFDAPFSLSKHTIGDGSGRGKEIGGGGGNCRVLTGTDEVVS